MFLTVTGASSSNISKTMSPWFVVMVIVDMPCASRLRVCELEAQRVAAHVGAVDGAGDALRLLRRHLEEDEALEQADVADRLAVDARRGDRGDQVARLEAGGAAAGDDHRARCRSPARAH